VRKRVKEGVLILEHKEDLLVLLAKVKVRKDKKMAYVYLPYQLSKNFDKKIVKITIQTYGK